jgi:hypothetical protein
MPHLVKWHDELSDAGLAVIGLHVQRATPDEVKAKARALRVRFPVTAGGAIEGVDAAGIPHCAVFDHAGRLVYDGHPNKAEPKLREAFAAMLADAAGETPARAVAAVLDGYRKGGTTADLFRKVTALQADADAATARQAKAIGSRLQSGAQARLDEAKTVLKVDPVAAYDATLQTATRWKGTALGKEAGELATRLKDDKLVASELKARPTLEKVRALEAAVTKAAKGAEPDSPEFKKAFAPQLKQLESAIKALKKQHPDAPATQEAEEIAGRLGVGK